MSAELVETQEWQSLVQMVTDLAAEHGQLLQLVQEEVKKNEEFRQSVLAMARRFGL